MRLKNFYLITVFLIAIIAIGAASASQDITDNLQGGELTDGSIAESLVPVSDEASLENSADKTLEPIDEASE